MEKFSEEQKRLISVIERVWPNYHVVSLLGSGQYGKVFLAERNDPGTDLSEKQAIKIIPLRSDNDANDAEEAGITEEEFYQKKKEAELGEIRMLQLLKGSTNVIHINDYYLEESGDFDNSYILIRMDPMTSLDKILRKRNEVSAAEAERFAKKVGLHICRALEHLENTSGGSAAHRDIKPANILMSANGDFYLADFGFARVLNTSAGLSYKGTQDYIAPEVGTKRYDYRVDIYSLGLVLYRLVNHGRPPYVPRYPEVRTAQDDYEASIQLRNPGRVLPKPDNCSDALADIICRMCAYDPGDRYPNAAAVEKALLDLDRPADLVPAPKTEKKEDKTGSPVREKSASGEKKEKKERKKLTAKTGKTIALACAAVLFVLLAAIFGGKLLSVLPFGEKTVSLYEMSIAEQDGCQLREEALNSLGMSLEDAVMLGGFGTESYASYYVEDYARIYGSFSCASETPSGMEGTLEIYADGNDTFPLLSEKITKTTVLTDFDLDISGAKILTIRLRTKDSTSPGGVLLSDVYLSNRASGKKNETDRPGDDASGSVTPIHRMTVSSGESSEILDYATNSLGMEFEHVLRLGGFSEECYATYYVEDYDRFTGAFSCLNDSNQELEGTLLIFLDNDEQKRVLSEKITRTTLLTEFDLDISDATFVTVLFRIEKGQGAGGVMLSDGYFSASGSGIPESGTQEGTEAAGISALSGNPIVQSQDSAFEKEAENSLGMTFSDPLVLSGFAKDYYARFYVKGYERFIGNVSISAVSPDELTGTFSIFGEDEGQPLFSAPLSKDTQLTEFDVDVSGTEILTVRFVSESVAYPGGVIVSDGYLIGPGESVDPKAMFSGIRKPDPETGKAADLGSFTASMNTGYEWIDAIEDSAGNSRKNVLVCRSFDNPCITKYYVKGYSAFTGNISCAAWVDDDYSATLTIYTDGNRETPLLQTEITKDVLPVDFDIKVEGSDFLVLELTGSKPSYPGSLILSNCVLTP